MLLMLAQNDQYVAHVSHTPPSQGQEEEWRNPAGTDSRSQAGSRLEHWRRGKKQPAEGQAGRKACWGQTQVREADSAEM